MNIFQDRLWNYDSLTESNVFENISFKPFDRSLEFCTIEFLIVKI